MSPTRPLALATVIAAVGILAAPAAAQETAPTQPAAPADSIAAVTAGRTDSVGTAPAQTRARRPRRNPNRLLPEEWAGIGRSDLADVIRSLRPRWVANRGPHIREDHTTLPVRVYVDGLPIGTIASLREVEIHRVRLVEYLDGPTATMRWGSDHSAGVIMVTTEDVPR